MRRSFAAAALISRRQKCQTLWLAQWNSHWGCYHFVGGHKRPNESFRQCMVREVAEEIGLHEGADYLLAPEPVAHLEYTAWSESAQTETAYTMELFELRLSGEDVRRKLDGNPQNRWLTEAEIRLGRCADGQPVSQTVALLLRKAGLWPETDADGRLPETDTADGQPGK